MPHRHLPTAAPARPDDPPDAASALAEAAARAATRSAALRRMKAVALAALLGAVALLASSHYFGRQGVWGWLGAFAEAATVGALADWFAVVALFRHPLGLPIPHTAILARNQQRIADNLAHFVRDKFLDKAVLLPRIEALNPAQKLGDWLSQPARAQYLAAQLQSWAAQSLDALDDPAIERDLLAIVKKQLHEWNAAPTAAQVVQLFTHGAHHQRALNAGLRKVAEWVGSPGIRLLIADKMIATARREYPKMSWLTDKLDYTEKMADNLADRLAQALIDEVQTVLAAPDHPLRQHYADEVVRTLLRLQDDPDMQQQVQQLKKQLLMHPALQGYVGQLWQRLRAWLHADLASPDSAIGRTCSAWAAKLGVRLRDDPLWQQAANAQLRIAAEHMAGQLRAIAPEHIRNTVQGWDTTYMVREIERSVGRDLQFIRLNGTLIGGLVGMALHALFVYLPRWLG